MTSILVLRPEPGASETLQRAKSLGLPTRAVPLFAVEALDWKAPEPGSFDGLLLTSANAVRCAGDQLHQLRGLPAYSIGAATASAAREAGFDIKATGDAGVDRLLGSIEPDLKLLHLCGEDRRNSSVAKQEITTVAVYRSREVAAPDLGDLESTVALIHSPRAGERLAQLVADKASVKIVAISAAAAEAAGLGWAETRTAAEPTDEAMLALAAELCNKSAPK